MKIKEKIIRNIKRSDSIWKTETGNEERHDSKLANKTEIQENKIQNIHETNMKWLNAWFYIKGTYTKIRNTLFKIKETEWNEETHYSKLKKTSKKKWKKQNEMKKHIINERSTRN